MHCQAIRGAGRIVAVAEAPASAQGWRRRDEAVAVYDSAQAADDAAEHAWLVGVIGLMDRRARKDLLDSLRAPLGTRSASAWGVPAIRVAEWCRDGVPAGALADLVAWSVRYAGLSAWIHRRLTCTDHKTRGLLD